MLEESAAWLNKKILILVLLCALQSCSSKADQRGKLYLPGNLILGITQYSTINQSLGEIL